MALFHQLHAEGNTIIIVTHEPEIAARCPRSIRILDGKITSDQKASRRREASQLLALGGSRHACSSRAGAASAARAEHAQIAKVDARRRSPIACCSPASCARRARSSSSCRARPRRGSSRSAGWPRMARVKAGDRVLAFDNSAVTSDLEEKQLALLEAQMTLQTARDVSAMETENKANELAQHQVALDKAKVTRGRSGRSARRSATRRSASSTRSAPRSRSRKPKRTRRAEARGRARPPGEADRPREGQARDRRRRRR